MEASAEFEDYISEQIFSSPIPPYRPAQYSELTDKDFHTCVDCGDRYILESSLNAHLSRQSVTITYFCKSCDQSLQFKNRCNLLAHIRQHPESSKNSSSILISPLPVSSVKCGNDENTSSEIDKEVVVLKSSTPVQILQSATEKVLDNVVKDIKNEGSVKIISITPSEVKISINETQKSNLVSKLVRCRECGENVENIKWHFFGDNKPFNPKIRCQCCDQILPTKCSLKAHLRIHFKKFPFICPDCMKEFTFFELFMVHLRYFCFHLDKCSRFKCQACPSIFPSLTSLEIHLATRHVKPVYKCTACPRAFFDQRLLNDHKNQSHGDSKIPTKFFEQCQLCPKKLLTKNCLFLHIHGHVMNKNVCSYSYKCSNCKFVTDAKLNFASHRLTCPASDNDANAHTLAKLASTSLAENGENNSLIKPKKSITSLLSNHSDSAIKNSGSVQLQGTKKNSFSTPSAMDVDCRPSNIQISIPSASGQLVMLSDEQKNIKKPFAPRIYKACGWYPNKCLMCQNELTLGTPFARFNCPLHYVGCSKWKLNDTKTAENFYNSMQLEQVSNCFSTISKSNKKNCMAFNGPSHVKKISALPSNSSTYLCHICKHSIQMNHAIIQKHFSQQHPEVELMSLVPLIYKFELPKLNIPLDFLKFSLKKTNLYQTITVKAKIPTALKKINPLGKKCLMKAKQNAFKNRNCNMNTVKHWLVCSKCTFKTKNRKTYGKHLKSHKPSYQCPECGLRFFVEPSLKKHRALHHGKVKSNAEDKTVHESSSANELSVETNSSDDNLNCKVCDKSFENLGDLQKHFRVHGMAFLMLNKNETVWRKV